MSNHFDLLDEILSDLERDKLSAFAEDTELVEAVRKVLLAGIYYNGTLQKGMKANPTNNFTLGLAANAMELKLSNEELGADLRASWEGIRNLEMAFSNIAKFKREVLPERSPKNPAK